MSINWHSGGCPAILVLPPDVVSLDEAHAAIELWEHYSRKTLDPDQRLVVEVMMATNSAGRWAAETTGREMPRQNGKGDELEVVELWGLVERGEAILHTVHDAVLLATQAQQRLLGVIEGHADLRRRMARRWLGTGQQMTEMRNGGVIWYRTRTSGGGRGVDNVDRVVMDEAQHATEEHAAAITPTLLANPNPQLNALGSAGIGGKSSWWWGVRRRALAPDPGRFGYVGHTVERVSVAADGQVVQVPVDVSDRRLWAGANPAIAAGRGGGMAFLEEQLRRLGADRFAREHLGVWDADPGAQGGERLFGAGVWEAVNAASVAQPENVTFAVAVHPDRTSAAIAVAGAGGSCGLVDRRAGVGWTIDELVRIAKPRGARVAVSSTGPSGSLIQDLERAGVTVVPIAGTDMRDACGWMFDAVLERKVVVQRHVDLDVAVVQVVKKPMGDAFVWERRAGDVSAFEALTLAAWVAQAPTVGPSRYEERGLRVLG